MTDRLSMGSMTQRMGMAMHDGGDLVCAVLEPWLPLLGAWVGHRSVCHGQRVSGVTRLSNS